MKILKTKKQLWSENERLKNAIEKIIDHNWIEKLIIGSLKDAITIHGPITKERMLSVSKKFEGTFTREIMKRAGFSFKGKSSNRRVYIKRRGFK